MKLTKPVPCVSRRTGNFCTSALQIEVYSSEVGCVVVCHMPREVIVIISVLIVFVMTPSDNACVTRFENRSGSLYILSNSPFWHTLLLSLEAWAYTKSYIISPHNAPAADY